MHALKSIVFYTRYATDQQDVAWITTQPDLGKQFVLRQGGSCLLARPVLYHPRGAASIRVASHSQWPTRCSNSAYNWQQARRSCLSGARPRHYGSTPSGTPDCTATVVSRCLSRERSPLSRLQAAIGVLQQNPAQLNAMIERMGREVERLDELVRGTQLWRGFRNETLRALIDKHWMLSIS